MKKRKVKKNNLFILCFIAILLVGGVFFGMKYFSKEDTDIKGYTNHKKEEKKEEPKVQIVDLESSTRPYAVMINNIGTARPYHSGLQDAYLVYELVAEAGITRYMALFKDKTPELVGSVRSARHYYLDYVLENDAYYVHWGWSPQARKDISSLKINNLNGLYYEGTSSFFRKYTNLVSYEHTGFVNLSEMGKLKDKLNYRSESNKDLLLNYSATSISSKEEGSVANSVDIYNSYGFTTNYQYDEASNTYKQFVNDKEHTDYQTKKQYTVKNIIAYQVKYSDIFGDEKGRQDIDNIGTGKGYFITEGKSYPITWEKKSRSSQTIYRYENGDEITVNDGNTWIHIVPTSGKISIAE